MKSRLLATGFLGLFILITPAAAQEANKQEDAGNAAKLRTLVDKFKSDDDRVRYEALQSISKIGRAALPVLAETLSKDKGYPRVYAARAIREIDPANQLAQRTLTEISEDKHEKLEVRRYASYVLALSPTGVPALVKMLDDEDVFVRRSAAFALRELFAISASLATDYRPALTNALPPMIACMGDEDSIVRGVAVETIEQVRGDIDFALDYCIEKSANQMLKAKAAEVKEKRKRGIKELGQQITMDMKPAAQETLKKDPKFRFGNLGVIYALRIGGEPVVDFRSLPDKDGWCLRVTLNSVTGHAGSGQSRFNPYQDLQ